jgi:hypothetical protein
VGVPTILAIPPKKNNRIRNQKETLPYITLMVPWSNATTARYPASPLPHLLGEVFGVDGFAAQTVLDPNAYENERYDDGA